MRGLKLIFAALNKNYKKSHPTWVRGLKLSNRHSKLRIGLVAPYVGAWIETSTLKKHYRHLESHPTWVRGLKPLEREKSTRPNESHPTWVRGLKRQKISDDDLAACRTLRGCVD